MPEIAVFADFVYLNKGAHFRGNLFSRFSRFFGKTAKIRTREIQFFAIFFKNWKPPRKMKEICPKKDKTAKINSREMQFFRFFFFDREN